MESVKQWTDEQIIEYLKEFWGVDEFVFECFMSDAPLFVTNKESYIGSLSQFRIMGNGVKISYPDIVANKYIFFNIRKLSNIYVNKGWCQISLRLASREFREKKKNPFLMTPIWRSLKRTNSTYVEKQANSIHQKKVGFVPKDKKDDNNPLLKDARTNVLIRKWGKSIFRLVGVYTISNGGIVSIECVRKVNFSRLESTPLSIPLTHPLYGLTNGDCVEFSWKYADDTGYDITIDSKSLIKKLGPQVIISRLYEGAIRNEDRSTDLAYNGIETNRINISGQDRNTFIYELLQNANDYPQKDSNGNKIPVHVEFEFEGDYLYFRHTGAKFSVQNVLGICGIGEKEKIDNIETIGYKGVGFKNVFIDCDYVYIKTGDYSFRFDKSKIERSAVSFETTPIWTTGIPIALRTSFENNKDYNVQIALKPRDSSIINLAEDGYIDRFLQAFNDPRIIIFIPWIESVTLKIPGHEDIICTKNGNEGNWLVSDPNDLRTGISSEIKMKIVEIIESRQGRMPEKYKFRTDTSVSFACKVEGNVLKPVEDSRIYCYLPTKDSWGFKFLMNTDMIPTGPRDGIEQQEYWNIEYSEIAGRAFFKWIKQLLEVGFDYDSVFALIPDFEECKIGRNNDHVNMISRFQKGFEECINTQVLIPVLGPDSSIEYQCIKNIICDVTSITGHDVFEDGTFIAFSKLSGKLAHPSLRLVPNFKRVLLQYGEKNLRFDKFRLWSLFQNVDFVTWLKDKDNNTRWTNFVVDKYPEEYSTLPMFISEHNSTRLYLAADLYYNIDDILDYLSAFAYILPRLSSYTRENCIALKGEKHLDKFKKNDVVGLVEKLFNETNTAFTQKTLEDKNNSVNFIKFIATKQIASSPIFNKIPLTDIDGKLIPIVSTSDSLRTLFFNSDFVSQIRKEQWFSNRWVSVLDEDYYSDDEMREYLKGYNVSELDDRYVINNLLVDKKCCEDVSVNVGASKEVSKEFIEYLFTHQDSIDGVEDKNKEAEKITRYDRFSGYSLFFVDGNGEEKLLPASRDTVFNEISDEYLHYDWFDNSWIYQVEKTYYEGRDENEKKEYAAFLKKYFGLVDLNDSRIKSIVKVHFEEIKQKVVANRECNLSFWTFLGKFQWNENSKDLNTFKATPLLFDGEELPMDISKKKNLYYYHDELHDIAKSSWMPGDLITILSKEYDSIPGIKDLLDSIGFATYDVRVFSPFFDNIIVNQRIPTTILANVSQTKYSVSLDTKEKCVDFHNFMSKKCSLLNDLEKSLLRGTPIYVYGKDGLRRLEVGYQAYILDDDKYGVLKHCSSGMFPEINALDPSFFTEESLPYWKDAMGCVTMDDEILCQWIQQNSDTISQTLQHIELNISFWSWLFDLGINSQAKIGRLKSIPIISFTARDVNNKEENQKAISLKSAEAYMSNSYMGQAQIEDFARKHGKSNFISSVYIREGDNIEEWKRFFKNLGVKDDVKDVIYSIIMNDLPTFEDKKFPWVLVDQFSKELADTETFKELAPKLRLLRVETTTVGVFVSIAEALRITVDDYSVKEPFKMVKLAGEISRDYYEDENVKNLINKIANEAQTKKIAELQQWVEAKVARYLYLQNTNPNDEFKEIHFAFIKDFLTHTEYNIPRCREIKLFDRGYNLINSKELYLGSKYECKCDFERFGIEKKYVCDDYLNLGKPKECTCLLRRIGCQDRFEAADVYLLTSRDFSIYFWCRYVGSNDITIISTINSLVKEGVLNEVACVPTESGDMKKPRELYSSTLADYMKYIPNYQDKIIDKKMLFSEPLIELCKQCLESLTISDIISFLINSKPKNRNRTTALQWLLDNHSNDKNVWISTYIVHEKACWLNGQGEVSHVSSLLAIDPNKCNQAYVFKSSPRVVDISYFPQGKELDVSKMFGITVFSDDDLVPKPVTTLDSGQTLKVSREIIRRLLLVIAYRYRFEWSDMFSQMKQKMQDVKFLLCESISYGYKDLSIENEDFYFDQNNKIFYYVDSWQDKKVYESFISNLCEFLSMDLDYRECKGKLDENFNGKKVANYLNQNCRDLYYDEEFISVIKQYWNDIVHLLDIKVEDELEMDDDDVIEDVTQEKYYEDELNEGQQEEQEDWPESEPQEEQRSEETLTDSARKNSQSTDSSKTTSSHDANTTSHSERPTESSSENDESQKTAKEQKTAADSKATERKESDDENNSSYDENDSKVDNDSYEEYFHKYSEKVKQFMEDGFSMPKDRILSEHIITRYRCLMYIKHETEYTIESGFDERKYVRQEFYAPIPLTGGQVINVQGAKYGLWHLSPVIWERIVERKQLCCLCVGNRESDFRIIKDECDLRDIANKKRTTLVRLSKTSNMDIVDTLDSIFSAKRIILNNDIVIEEGYSNRDVHAMLLIKDTPDEDINSMFDDYQRREHNNFDINWGS